MLFLGHRSFDALSIGAFDFTFNQVPLRKRRQATRVSASPDHLQFVTITESAERFNVPPAWIAGMIAIEALRVPKTFHFDPVSLRDEDDQRFVDYKTRPHRVSAGLMQTLFRLLDRWQKSTT